MPHCLLYRRLHFTDIQTLIELIDCAHQRLALGAIPASKVQRVIQGVLVLRLVSVRQTVLDLYWPRPVQNRLLLRLSALGSTH